MLQAVLTAPDGRVVIQQGGFPTREDAFRFIHSAPSQQAQADCCGHWSIEAEESASDGYACPYCGFASAAWAGRDCPGCGSN